MDQTVQNDLFEVRVTRAGKYYIRKFAIIARIIILIGILISLVHVATTVISYIIFDPSKYTGYKYLLLEIRLLPYYTVLFCILFYPQLYYYWKVAKYLQEGLNLNDDDTFNKAFRSLFRYAVFGIASAFLSLLFYGLELLIYVIYYL